MRRISFLFAALMTLLPIEPALAAGNVPYLYATHRDFRDLDSNDVVIFQGTSRQRSITVGTDPKQLAASPDSNRIYVTNSKSNSVSVIDTVSNTVTATIGVGVSPLGVAVSPDGLSVYVTNNGANTVSVIDTATNTVTRTITVGGAPTGVAFSPAGNKAYVALAGAQTVIVIDAATGAVTASIAGFSSPQRIVVSPDGNTAYVSNQGNDSVSFVNLATNTIARSVPAISPRGFALLPNGSALYVSNAAGNSGIITAIDTATFATTSIDVTASQEGEIIFFGGYTYSNTLLFLSQIDVGSNTHAANVSIGIRTAGLLMGFFGNAVNGVVGSGAGTIGSVGSVVGGNSVSLPVQPAAGNQITSVTTDACDGRLSGNTYNTGAVITRLCTVTANFAPIPSFSCVANSSPGNRTVVSCTNVAAGGTLTVTGATCGSPTGGNATCSGNTSSTGTAPQVTLSLNGGSLTVDSTPTFTVVGVVGNGNGTITASQVVASGATASLLAQPAIGSHVESVTTDTCEGTLSGMTYTTGAVTAACTVTAVFALDTFAITATANPVSGGTVTCNPNPVSYGGNASCTATASPGYTFSTFSGDCAGARCDLTNVTAARSVTATFTLNTYAIRITVNPLDGGSVTCSPNPVPYGGNASCTATAGIGYTFSAFSGDCAGARCDLANVTDARSVTATFTLNTYLIGISVNPADGGSVTCSPNPVGHGSSSTCTATPSTGYSVQGISGCGGTATAPGVTIYVSGSITAACTVAAAFTPISYAIATTAIPKAGGTVTCNPDPVPYGGSVTCIAIPSVGYLFRGFSGDCSGLTCTVNKVTAPLSINATFALKPTVVATPFASGWCLLVMGVLIAGAAARQLRRGRASARPKNHF